MSLSLPHRNDAKIAKICNFWPLWPVIKLMNHLFKIRKKAFLKRWFISWIRGQNVQRLQIFAIFASFLWGNLNIMTKSISTVQLPKLVKLYSITINIYKYNILWICVSGHNHTQNVLKLLHREGFYGYTSF